MTNLRYISAASLALVLGVSALSVGVTPAYACGDGHCEPPPEPTTKGNNGWGQEKHGGSDGTNAGSDDGTGGSPNQESTKTASTER